MGWGPQNAEVYCKFVDCLCVFHHVSISEVFCAGYTRFSPREVGKILEVAH